MRRLSAVGLLLCAVAVSPAWAGQAEICYSTPVAYNNAVPPTNSTVFNCPTLGAKTLPQLAQAGWEVVQLVPVSTGGGTQVTDQLVIQKTS